MTLILSFTSDAVTPDRRAVLELQGIPAARAEARIGRLCSQALGRLSESAEPAGILQELSTAQFETVYRGQGLNQPGTPVGDLFARADHLALFVVTLGTRVSREIERCFAAREFALGSMLDSAASAAADRMATLAERHFADLLSSRERARASTTVLAYSPGYCGWHVSGQQSLFGFLRPERIGVTLRDSFLMEPLKSISGVLIAGPAEIHAFPDSYACCEECEARGCRERIRALAAGPDGQEQEADPKRGKWI